MKANIRVSVKKIILSAVFLSVSVINFSQSCPLSAGDYKLNTQSAAEANIVKRTESGGVTYNRLWCPYKATGQPDISFYVNWVTHVPNNKFKYTWTCMSIVSSKDIINAGNKQAYATFGGYPVNDDYRRGLLKPLAEKILQEVYPLAAPCPLGSISDNSNNINQGNADACRKNFEKLRQFLEKRSGISQQLTTLRDPSYNETTSRKKLSRFSKYVAMAQDPKYGIFPNRFPAELERLDADLSHRSAVATEYGINPGASLLEVLRAVRDITAARIDYFKKAPGFIQQYNKELAVIEKDLERLHRENTQLKCPGDYDIKSCDLSGEWILTRWDTDPDNGTYDEIWRFTPVSKGRYTALNTGTGHLGEAETFGRRVRFTVKPGQEHNILHTFLLNELCDAGGGNSNIRVASPRMTIRRTDRTAITFVNDKLYSVQFRGKNYQSVYKQELHNGIPIDEFFFKINLVSGYQAEQNGEKLWGKFVRNPSTGHHNQSDVQWWFSNWVNENNKWVKKDEKITAPPQIR